jgi:hypothetical protein
MLSQNGEDCLGNNSSCFQSSLLSKNTVICQGYAVGGSETGNISQDIVS